MVVTYNHNVVVVVTLPRVLCLKQSGDLSVLPSPLVMQALNMTLAVAEALIPKPLNLSLKFAGWVESDVLSVDNA